MAALPTFAWARRGLTCFEQRALLELTCLPAFSSPTPSSPLLNPQIDSVIATCRHRACVRALFSATLPEAVEGLARSVLKDPLRITVGERNTGALGWHGLGGWMGTGSWGMHEPQAVQGR